MSCGPFKQGTIFCLCFLLTTFIKKSLNPSRPNPGRGEKGLKGLHKTF